MKKSHYIILVQLCVQVLVGGLFFIILLFNFSSKFNGIGLIEVYITSALGSILISLLIISYRYKQSRSDLLSSSVLSGSLWVIFPILYVLWNNVFADTSGESYQRIIKKASLNASKQMGLSNYKWDPSINQCIINTEDGKQHAFSLRDNKLHIYCKIQQPVSEDTLAWLRLTLTEASVYLNIKAYKILDSCIRSGNYFFSSTKDPLNVEIGIYPADSSPEKIGISSKVIHEKLNTYPFGNFYITMQFGIQTKQ